MEVCISDHLDEVSNEDLLAEIARRNLQALTVFTAPPPSKQSVGYVVSDLMAKRPLQALAELRGIIAKAVPAHLLAAYEAIIDGRISDAICELDHVIDPSPSATLTKLPKKVA